MQEALDFRTALMEAGGCTYSLTMTVEQEERVYTFAGQCNYQAEKGAEMVLTAPEELSGISLTVDAAGTAVSLEEVAVEIGAVAGQRIRPLEVPLLLGDCWESAYIASCGREEDQLLAVYTFGYGTDQLEIHTWLDEQTGCPDQWEIYHEDKRIVYGGIEDFSFGELW